MAEVVHPAGGFAVLDADSLTKLLSFLDGASLARFGCTSATILKLSAEHAPALWTELHARDHARVAGLCTTHREPLARWRAGDALTTLSCVSWRRSPLISGTAFAPREGSACAVYNNKLFMFGGWTVIGMGMDVTHLALSEEDSGFTATRLRVSAASPSPRYGHSVTACSSSIILFGGMTGGGYTGERNDLWFFKISSKANQLEGEWSRPVCSGTPPPPCGYHSATHHEGQLYVFGGISAGEANGGPFVLDLATLVWTDLSCSFAPPARFGHSAHVFRESRSDSDGLYIFGGGNGGDLLRDGVDLCDVWRFDLLQRSWRRIATSNGCPTRDVLGRCHSSSLVGAKVVFFGGSKRTSNRVLTLDLDTSTFQQPTVAAVADGLPAPRFTHLAAVIKTELIIACGWQHANRGMRSTLGDVWRLDLAPPDAVRSLVLDQEDGDPEDGDPEDSADEDFEDDEENDEEESDDDDVWE